MQFKKKLIPFTVVIGLALAGSAMAQEVIKIGHVGPTSGPIAHAGKDIENGARMAIDELNAKGITLAGKKVKFELLAEDDAADPKQGNIVAQKLVDAKVSGVVGHLNSGTTIPASKIYFAAGIPQISPSSTAPQYTQQGFKSAFRVVANDGQLGGTLGRYAVQVSKAKRIAVIDDATAYGVGVTSEFKKGIASQGRAAEIVASEHTTDKATDFNAILTAIKAKKPDLIFFGGSYAVAGPMLKQMKALGMDAKFMGGDGMCTDSLIQLAGDALGDARVTCAEAGGVNEAGKPGLDAFKAAYQKQFNRKVLIYAPYAYDAVYIMVAAMQQANSGAPDKYLPFLAKASYQGITGKIEFDAKGDLKDAALTLYTYRGGQREVLAVTR